MKRLMIAAMQSGSGKTVLSCALMRALQRRGLQVRALKCGPDYIDPLFHTRILGIPSRNLDLFLQGEDGIRRTLGRMSGDIAVLEGVMGFYDGLQNTETASSWQLASLTGTPVLLVLRPKGQSLTLAAQVRGLLQFRPENRIAGLFLSDCSEKRFADLKKMLSSETGLPVFGFLPHMPEADFSSRHLGLITPDEVDGFSARFDALADTLERTADLDGLLDLAGEARDAEAVSAENAAPIRCRVAVARDEAFSFYYEDNLDALRESGTEPVFFSPLRDSCLPEADGLYLGGGYPELFLSRLSGNRPMRESICTAVRSGLPTVAECGGFLYLQQAMRDAAGYEWPVAAVLPGVGFDSGRLCRFGYLTLRAGEDSLLFRAGEEIPAHEFHHWDSTEPGNALTAVGKNGERRGCGFVSPTLYAAFPHLHWGGSFPMARRFAEAAESYGRKKK